MTAKMYKVGCLTEDGDVYWFGEGSYSLCETIIAYNKSLDDENDEYTEYFIEKVDIS